MLKSNNNLLENFNKACKIVKVLPKRPSDDDLLYLKFLSFIPKKGK